MEDQYVVIGRFGAAHGVKGWIRVTCFTENKDTALNYQPWFKKTPSGWSKIHLTSYKQQAKHLVVQIEGCEDRNQAQLLTNIEIAAQKSSLPTLEGDQYYWADLEGLTVIGQDGQELGVIDHLLETGANDVMVVLDADKQRFLVPFIMNTVVKSVNLTTKKVLIDWELS
jgi:16S rRNA processing protein RimM